MEKLSFFCNGNQESGNSQSKKIFLGLVRKIRFWLLGSQACSPSSVLTAFVWGFSFVKGKGLAGRGESDGSAGKRRKRRILHKITVENNQFFVAVVGVFFGIFCFVLFCFVCF